MRTLFEVGEHKIKVDYEKNYYLTNSTTIITVDSNIEVILGILNQLVK